MNKWGEDFIFNSILENELQSFQNEEITGDLVQPKSALFQFYDSIDAVPNYLHTLLQKISPGVHEIEDFDLHVAVGEFVETGKRYYFISNTQSLEYMENRMSEVLFWVLIVIIITSIIALFLMRYLVRITLQPLSLLTQEVQNQESSAEWRALNPRFKGEDEIGILARSLDDAFARIQKYALREKEFSSDASHELRTPVSVIKGALELLEHTKEPVPMSIRRPIDRIKRSSLKMEALINTFLIMAREESHNLEQADVGINSIIQKSIQLAKEIYPDKNNKFCYEAKRNISIYSNPVLLEVLVNNVLFNAQQYTYQGVVSIEVMADNNSVSFTVRNSLSMSSNELDNLTARYRKNDDSPGYGIGSSIIKRICEICNWQFNCRYLEKSKEAEIRIEF